MMPLREIWDRVIVFLRQLFGRSIEELDLTAKKKRPRRKKWWEFPFRIVSTSRGGPNMPKSQSCPRCHAATRRTSKAVQGAHYSCRCHEVFFIQTELTNRAPSGPFKALRPSQLG